jgi:hypothetical protein
MKRLLLAVALAAAIATPVLAAPQIRIIAPNRAPQFQGSVMAVRGRAEVRPNEEFQGTDVRLIGPGGRTEFTGFIPLLNMHEFPNVNDLNGREVVMWGVIEIYRGRGATQLIYADQLQAWPPRQRTAQR